MTDLLKTLYSPKTDKKIILSNLKQENYSSCRKKLKVAVSHPLAKSLILANPLPKSVRAIKNVPLSHFTDNLEGELAWLMHSIVQFSTQINYFLEKEFQFEQYLFLGEYSEAKKTLNNIESDVCFSLWGLENQYFLTQKEKGVEENWKLLSKLNLEITNTYSLFLNTIFSKKAETDISLLQYKQSIETAIRKINPHDSEYIIFRLGYFFNKNYRHFPFFLFIESNSSIIDRYIVLISVLTEIIAENDGSFSLAISIVKELRERIKDSRLDRLWELAQSAEFTQTNADIYDLFELYSHSYYEKCIDLIPSLLLKYPSHIELYEIYIKCLVGIGLPYKPTNISDTIDYVILNLYNILIRNEDYFISRENLLKLFLSSPSLRSHKQILGLVAIMSGMHSHKNIFSINFLVFSKFSNPAVFILKNEINKSPWLEILIAKYDSFKINYGIGTGTLESFKTNDDIEPHRYILYSARSMYKLRNYNDCISLLSKNISNFLENPIQYEEVVYLLYYSYTSIGRTGEAVKLCIESYFLNENYVARLDMGVLTNQIIEDEYNVEKNIDLPIFFFINSLDSYYLYVALDEYFLNRHIERPSEIIDTDAKTIFLLKNVCEIEVLDKFYLIYTDFSEVVEERKNILQKLISIDKNKENITNYFEQLAAITQKEKINKLINKVNDGKINLNFSKIKTNKDYNLESGFSRFLKFSEFSKSNHLNLYDAEELLKGYINELNENSKQLHDPSFLSFKSLFFEVINHFLFSKEYGLDGDISTRIRHGALENQMRSIFMKNHLISKKDQNGNYENIEYFIQLGKENNYRDNIITLVQEKLNNFSKSIDGFIQYIVNEQMQIISNKYRDKEHSLFNYNFSEDFLWVVYRDITATINTYDEFTEYIFQIITTHTETLLKAIRQYFLTNVNAKIQSELNTLNSDMHEILKGRGILISEISQSIINSKTQIYYEIQTISEWFKIINSQKDIVLDIDTIIHTSIELINFANPNDVIKPKIICNDKGLYDFYSSLIDILTIILGNIITHSKLQSNELNILIKINTENVVQNKKDKNLTKVIISVSNNFNQSFVDTSTLVHTFTEIKDKWYDLSSLNANKEGRSGYLKIKRIINHEINAYGNGFDFRIENDILEISLSLTLAKHPLVYE